MLALPGDSSKARVGFQVRAPLWLLFGPQLEPVATGRAVGERIWDTEPTVYEGWLVAKDGQPRPFDKLGPLNPADQCE